MRSDWIPPRENYGHLCSHQPDDRSSWSALYMGRHFRSRGFMHRLPNHQLCINGFRLRPHCTFRNSRPCHPDDWPSQQGGSNAELHNGQCPWLSASGTANDWIQSWSQCGPCHCHRTCACMPTWREHGATGWTNSWPRYLHWEDRWQWLQSPQSPTYCNDSH